MISFMEDRSFDARFMMGVGTQYSVQLSSLLSWHCSRRVLYNDDGHHDNGGKQCQSLIVNLPIPFS